jgi:hypothetical protein
MSAMNASINSTSLDAERRSHEPSMEEILASIRRIIADDDALPVMRREREKEKDKCPPPPVEAPPKREESARAATPAPEPRRPLAAAVPAPEPARAPVAIAPAPAREPQPAPAVEATAPARPEDLWLRGDFQPDDESAEDEPEDEQSRWATDAEEEGLASENYDEAEEIDDDPETAQRDGAAEAESASPLVSPDAANSIASHFQALAASIVISESDLVERYARELLRPLLKQWLDDNLPHIVERLVRAEIERVARGRR